MKEFITVFQISKTIIFKVNYYILRDNERAYFTTSAAQFCRSKRDYTQGGQAQDALLPLGSKARKFWQKWDCEHLRTLSPEKYAEMIKDLEGLKAAYNFICRELDETRKPYNPYFPFWQVVELSKQTPKAKSITRE